MKRKGPRSGSENHPQDLLYIDFLRSVKLRLDLKLLFIPRQDKLGMCCLRLGIAMLSQRIPPLQFLHCALPRVAWIDILNVMLCPYQVFCKEGWHELVGVVFQVNHWPMCFFVWRWNSFEYSLVSLWMVEVIRLGESTSELWVCCLLLWYWRNIVYAINGIFALDQ
jgi:hypothetical protein